MIHLVLQNYIKEFQRTLIQNFLSTFQKGVMGLIKNKGKMQLILSTEVSETTMKDIKKGYESRFIKSFVDEIIFPESYDYKEDIKELSFLISIGLIDVKIALKEKRHPS